MGLVETGQEGPGLKVTNCKHKGVWLALLHRWAWPRPKLEAEGAGHVKVQGAGESCATLAYSRKPFGLRPPQSAALKLPAAYPSESWISLSELCMEAFTGSCQ